MYGDVITVTAGVNILNVITVKLNISSRIQVPTNSDAARRVSATLFRRVTQSIRH